jgi:hypothetical protein
MTCFRKLTFSALLALTGITGITTGAIVTSDTASQDTGVPDSLLSPYHWLRYASQYLSSSRNSDKPCVELLRAGLS